MPPDGWKIVRNLTQGLSQPTRTALAIQAAAMLHAGVDATDITTGLETWMSRPDARIGLFRHLVDDAVKARRAPTAAANTGVPVAHHDRKTLGWEEAAEAAKRSLGLIPGDNQPALPAPGDRPLLTILDSDYVQEIA
ncbi:hypothetical protein [Nocardia ignorata]|uniref:hypothetical protein n=1 Tax=Nocardia ignorata TaxID=145285 RepID=UPI00082E39D6|nr:hypothetical protein [Nocardia ignorata]